MRRGGTGGGGGPESGLGSSGVGSGAQGGVGGGDSVPGKNVVIPFYLTPARNLSGVID